ncbi:MAG: hypothetical protein ABIM43_06195 [candidate division WOR-3 bacterium]
MENDMEILRSLKKVAPRELDFRVKSCIKKYRVKIYAFRLLGLFFVFFSFGAFMAVFLTREVNIELVHGLVQIRENPHNRVYPGIVPVKLRLIPPGTYVYKVYVNGETHKEGYVEENLQDSIFLQDPVNNVEVEIEDLISGTSRYISWVVFNF